MTRARPVDVEIRCKNSDGNPAIGVRVKVGSHMYPETDKNGLTSSSHASGEHTVTAYTNYNTSTQDTVAGPFLRLSFKGSSRFCLNITLKDSSVASDKGSYTLRTGPCPSTANVQVLTFDGSLDGNNVPIGGVQVSFVGTDGRVYSYVTNRSGQAQTILTPDIYTIVSYSILDYNYDPPRQLNPPLPFSNPQERDMVVPRDYVIKIPSQGDSVII